MAPALRFETWLLFLTFLAELGARALSSDRTQSAIVLVPARIAEAFRRSENDGAVQLSMAIS